MTVVYTHDVATGRGFGNFVRLLFRWKGSIYKVVIPDLIVYSLCYCIISVSYRYGIKENAENKESFEKLVKYCADYAGVIPVSFVLGFYVSQIVTRWWNQFMTIPWPDTLAYVITTCVHGSDERGRLMRRTMVRHTNLSYVMTLSTISPQCKARFPTMDHLIDAGFMLPHEKLIFEHLDSKADYPKYWIPLVWAGNIAVRARREGRITDDVSLINIITCLCRFRTSCGDLIGYDWVCIPLVYTQVVTLAVYLYFISALFGKQFIDDEHEIDLYVPVFLFLEFFFYMGWLKVAETMVNPFGEDDDDFEINWLVDRNISLSYLIADEMYEDHPELARDQFWDEVVPKEIPYTKASEKYKIETHPGSAALILGDNLVKLQVVTTIGDADGKMSGLGSQGDGRPGSSSPAGLRQLSTLAGIGSYIDPTTGYSVGQQRPRNLGVNVRIAGSGKQINFSQSANQDKEDKSLISEDESSVVSSIAQPYSNFMERKYNFRK